MEDQFVLNCVNEMFEPMMKKLNSRLPDTMEFSKLVNDVENETPMTMTILCMTYLDTALRVALESHFSNRDRELLDLVFDGESAPLGTLASKATLATALGFISDEVRCEISALRKIRNTFAHALHDGTWDEPKIQRLVSKLTIGVNSVHRIGVELDKNFQDVEPQVITLIDGTKINTDNHYLNTDTEGYIGFYCLSASTNLAAHPTSRKYLASFWACMFLLSVHFTRPWIATHTQMNEATKLPEQQP